MATWRVDPLKFMSFGAAQWTRLKGMRLHWETAMPSSDLPVLHVALGLSSLRQPSTAALERKDLD